MILSIMILSKIFVFESVNGWFLEAFSSPTAGCGNKAAAGCRSPRPCGPKLGKVVNPEHGDEISGRRFGFKTHAGAGADSMHEPQAEAETMGRHRPGIAVV